MINFLNYHIFPGTCILCDLNSKRQQDLCPNCENNLPWLTNLLPNNIFASFHYQEPIAHLITNLKFNHKLIYAKILGDLMVAKLKQQNSLPELIIPVPLHKKRLKERGFNQALEIARPIAKQLNIPIDFNSCQRIKPTEAQSLIPAKQRQQNVKGAFIVKQEITAKHVVIIDDVVTTGNTTKELSYTLQQAGVTKIDIWCCAKTSL